MKVPFADLARQNLPLRSALLDAFERVVDSGRYLMGPTVGTFENALAASLGLSHAVTTASGTDSCELAIRAVGWGPGSTVATPAFGAVPTIAAIEAAGATPVLVDVDPVTRGVSFETLAQARTDGAVVVHMFGQLCDVPDDAIEDCAHAQGAARMISNLPLPVLAGQQGIAGAFSFFPTKCLGALGDGGAVVTDDPEIAARVRALRHYGGLLDGDVTMQGQNSRLSELGAALLSVKLARLDEYKVQRMMIAGRYRAELKGHITVPTERPWEAPSYHCFVVEHPERDRIKAALEARGIGTMIHYPKPIHFYRRWRHLGAPGDFPVSERLAATVLSLPCFPGFREDEQDAVIAAIKECT
jgi:dTDP-4-amino-4,6-dideoxygalactose transaminase